MQTGITLVSVSESLADLARRLGLQDALEDVQSSGDARRLLRWLRNLQAIDQSMEEWLAIGTQEEQAAKLQQIQELAALYAVQLRQSKAQGEAVEDANQAVSAMALAALEHALSRLPAGHPDAARLAALISGLPQKAELRVTQAVQHLLRLVEIGLERTSGKQVSEQSPVDRLVEMSKRIKATALELQSIDTLKTPAREEAVELAREILRKLKLSLGDKQVMDGLGHARPEEKARLSEKLAEMVDMYKNLLFEAAQTTPGILDDPRVKQANDTVGGFSHAVTLMAAREMPTSAAAAAQQISAEAASMPNQWKHLSGQTVSRLMNNMEHGLEKAVSEIELQQQEAQARQQQQHAEVTQSLAAEDTLTSRRNRRARRASGGITKVAARRSAGDLNGDGVLDKYQGLKPEDLALAKQLGDSLRGLGKQVASAPPIDIRPPVEKRSRGSSTQQAADREKERRQQQKQNQPKNPQNPRGGQNGPRV
jgi:hypothetical protein